MPEYATVTVPDHVYISQTVFHGLIPNTKVNHFSAYDRLPLISANHHSIEYNYIPRTTGQKCVFMRVHRLIICHCTIYFTMLAKNLVLNTPNWNHVDRTHPKLEPFRHFYSVSSQCFSRRNMICSLRYMQPIQKIIHLNNSEMLLLRHSHPGYQIGATKKTGKLVSPSKHVFNVPKKESS